MTTDRRAEVQKEISDNELEIYKLRKESLAQDIIIACAKLQQAKNDSAIMEFQLANVELESLLNN